MNVDPTINLVVFEIWRDGRAEKVVGQGATRDAHCIRGVWEALQRKHSIKTNEVLQIYSEWQPSPEDIAFLDKHFLSQLKVSYSFERPAEHEWDGAFEQVRQIIQQSMERDTAEAMTEDRSGFAPLPVLKNLDGLSDPMVYRLLVPGLAVFLANVGMTPRGSIGIDYVMAKTLQEQGGKPAALWKQAFSNLAGGLKVNAGQKDGQPLFIIERPAGMAASAIGIPNFEDKVENWLGSKRIVVGIPNPDTLVMCPADSRLVGYVREMALRSTYTGAVNLTPCLLLLDNGRLSLEARRPES